MGYQERDYYRDDSPESGFQIKSWVVRLIIINCVVFLANALTTSFDPASDIGQNRLTYALAVYGNTIVQPWYWWKFLSAGFAHNPLAIWHVAGNMIGLYVFGRPIEEKLGSKEFLRFYLLAIVLGSVIWSARQYLTVGPALNGWARMFGASGGVTALIVLFCLQNPRATLLLFFAIPMPAWMFGILVVVSDLTGTRLPGHRLENIAFDVHLVGAALAAVYWSLGLNFGRVPGMRELSTGWKKVTGLFRSRPQMRVHRQDDDDDEELDDRLEAEGDRLLAKIAREGEASLSAQERRTLENYSRRMREKRR